MLALGTAFLTLTFSLIDAALFRPPPFREVGRLMMVYNLLTAPREPGSRLRWSFPRIRLLRNLSAEFAAVANYSPNLLTLTHAGEAEAISAEVVSQNYFSLLGTGPAVGRVFLPEEDSVPGAHPVVLLGHGLFHRRFGTDSAIVGRTIRINGQDLLVIGVLQPGFRGLSGVAELWIPAAMAPRLTYPEYLTSDQHFISAVARLRPGLTQEQAESRFAAVGNQVATTLPNAELEPGQSLRTTVIPLSQARVSQTVRRSLTLLLWGAVLLHLLAVSNVINLSLGRSLSRRREAAILVAIGGSTWRRLLHFGSETVTLAGLGSLLGVSVAGLLAPHIAVPPDAWGPRSLYGSLSTFADPGFGARTVRFGLGLTLLTMALVGWAPLVSLVRPDVTRYLRDGAAVTKGTATLKRPSLRGLIVALEAALAILLLVAGGLLLDSFRRMQQTDLGVQDPERVLSFWIRPSEAVVPVDRAPAFVARVLAAVKAVPGVEAVTVDGGAPLSGTARSTLVIASRPPASPQDAPPVLRHYIAPDHFRVLGIPLLRGRVFGEGDVAGGPRVAIISQTAARQFWPDSDPIGERVWFNGGSSFNSSERSAEIVGIVGDVAYEPLDVRNNRSSFYTPYQQFTYAARTVLVRAQGDPLALVSGIRRALRQVDPDLPMVEVQTLKAQIGASWARQRFDAMLFGGFAVLALLLAGTGVYSVVSFAVRQRTREMGIRMALGAQPVAILKLIVSEGMAFPLIGLAAGAAGSLAVARLIRGSLYQVPPGDARVPLTTLVLLLAVSVLACYLPARRATEVDPASTLRAE